MALSILLLFCGYAMPIQGLGQKGSGVLFIKKNDRTIKTYFPGQDILVYNTGGGPVSGNIERITHDSLYLMYYQSGMVPTFAGTRVLDTMGKYPIHIAINEIGAIPAIRKRRNVFTSGTTYMIAGGAYLAVNAINTVREKQPYFGSDNIPRILAGLAGVAFGYLIEKLRKDKFIIGTTYTLTATD